jgi:hypothetical protein
MLSLRRGPVRLTTAEWGRRLSVSGRPSVFRAALMVAHLLVRTIAAILAHQATAATG